jgi:hypothetical protein
MMKLDLRDAKDVTGLGPAPAPGPPVATPTPPPMLGQQTPPVAFLANVARPVATLCDKAMNLCRDVAPLDLAGLPVYVVPQSAIAANFGNAEATYGYTLASLDLLLRDEIGTSWQGRGPCMVINDIAMQQDIPGSIEAEFLSTVLHELAHVFESQMAFNSTPAMRVAQVKADQQVVAQTVQQHPPRWNRLRSYQQHDHRFFRALFHLRHRAERQGVRLSPFRHHDDSRDTLMTMLNFRDALGEEPERLRKLSLRDILASPCPAEFCQLWIDDYQKFLNQILKETA